MDTFDIILLSILAIAVVAIFAIDLWRQRKKGGLTLETAEEIAEKMQEAGLVNEPTAKEQAN